MGSTQGHLIKNDPGDQQFSLGQPINFCICLKQPQQKRLGPSSDTPIAAFFYLFGNRRSVFGFSI